MARPLRELGVAIAGLGGFAGAHHAAVQAIEVEGLCRLVGTCDPDLAGQGEVIQKFGLRDRGVALYPGLSEMLAAEGDRVDVVLLPTPIPLHAEQHRLVIESGKACYLEKPPTLWWPEYLEMLDVERKASKATQIGFNFVGDPLRRAIKARLLAGEFGEVKGATLFAIWPRNTAYYQRNDWAGRISVNGRPVRDSCIGNALAHNVQDLLFWLGDGTIESVSRVQSVRARLVRAHPIESFDTVFAEAQLEGNRWLRIGATHTGTGKHSEREAVLCSGATITFEAWHRARIEHTDGSVEHLESDLVQGSGVLGHNIREYLLYMWGERPRPITTLEDSRSFVALHNLAFLSSQVVEVFDETRVEREVATGLVGVDGLEESFASFVDEGRWPGPEPHSAEFGHLEGILE